MTTELKTLEKQQRAIQEKINEIEYAKKSEEARKLVGKCYRYRNNYSCPKKASDYWWLYMRIISADGYGHMKAIKFQKDSYGHTYVNFDELMVNVSEGYEEISDAEFQKQWNKLMKYQQDKMEQSYE